MMPPSASVENTANSAIFFALVAVTIRSRAETSVLDPFATACGKAGSLGPRFRKNLLWLKFVKSRKR